MGYQCVKRQLREDRGEQGKEKWNKPKENANLNQQNNKQQALKIGGQRFNHIDYAEG